MSRLRKLTSVLLLLVTFMLLMTPQAVLAAGPCTTQLESDFSDCTNAFVWYDPRRHACNAGAELIYGACTLEELVT